MADEYVPKTREYDLSSRSGGRSVGFTEAVKSAFANYVNFSGRAQRAEYWWFILFTFIGSMVTGVIDGVVFGWDDADGEIFSSIFSLAVLLPSLAVGWRRLHDTGRTGAWLLLPYGVLIFAVVAIVTTGMAEAMSAIVVVALIVLTLASFVYVIVLLCLDSDPHSNRFGPSPKYGSQADIFT